MCKASVCAADRCYVVLGRKAESVGGNCQWTVGFSAAEAGRQWTCDTLFVPVVCCRHYDKDLHLLLNNCMHYTNGLCKLLLTDSTQAG